MPGKRIRSSYYTRAKRGEVDEPEHVPNAAERVFATPYLARDIVQWAGLSRSDALRIAPAMHRLGERDPAFKAETKRMLRQLTPEFVEPRYWWEHLKLVYKDEDGKIRREEKIMPVERGEERTRIGVLSYLVVSEYDENRVKTFAAEKYRDEITVGGVDDVILREQNGDFVYVYNYSKDEQEYKLVRQEPGPYIRRNQSLRPDLWLTRIRHDTYSENDVLYIDEE